MSKNKIMIAFRSMAFDKGLSTSQAAELLISYSDKKRSLLGNTLNSWCYNEYYIPAWALKAAIRCLEVNGWAPSMDEEWQCWATSKRDCRISSFDGVVPEQWNEHQQSLAKLWLKRCSIDDVNKERL